jgi:hypothetical protein
LKIRGCCGWGNCEQDCTVIYRKYFSCFSTIPVCTCVRIAKWERRIVVIQRRTVQINSDKFSGTVREPCGTERIRNYGIQRALLEETKRIIKTCKK